MSDKPTYISSGICCESECGRTGIYQVEGKAYCSAHKELAQRAAAVVTANFDRYLRRIKPRYWRRKI